MLVDGEAIIIDRRYEAHSRAANTHPPPRVRAQRRLDTGYPGIIELCGPSMSQTAYPPLPRQTPCATGSVCSHLRSALVLVRPPSPDRDDVLFTPVGESGEPGFDRVRVALPG